MSEPIGIAGYGRFGRALAELFRDAGREILACDPKAHVPREISVASLADLAARAETLVLAVPVAALDETLTSLLPHLGADHFVIDVCSVKLGPEQTLRARLGERVPWAATHPLFGPASLARGERPLEVVVCKNDRHPEHAARARALFESIGCVTRELSAEEHDRAMADTHVLAFFIAKALLDLQRQKAVAFAPPSFKAIERTVDAVRVDAGHLFYAIEHENPFAGEARRRFMDALANVHEQVESSASGSQEARSLEIPEPVEPPPQLMEVRDLIDEVDREIVAMLARRAELARRAARAKADEGRAVRDADREDALLRTRSDWAQDLGLDSESVRDIFDAILRMSRKLQRI